jgi:hypothetical protein
VRNAAHSLFFGVRHSRNRWKSDKGSFDEAGTFAFGPA